MNDIVLTMVTGGLRRLLGTHASLSKEVVVVGAGDRLELWGRTAWSEHRPTLLSGVAEVTARVDAA